ncbi:hypothetical protein AALO_G00218710 [Alosa alosa]|uniref:HMG box domain-containing protein n=1 Tax=Alosa alosa TaxID=278164 RepID=A0AAV6G0Z2_9TELE|nr:hypothetical protein AALO_G00218710 [Alosa alosa]
MASTTARPASLSNHDRRIQTPLPHCPHSQCIHAKSSVLQVPPPHGAPPTTVCTRPRASPTLPSSHPASSRSPPTATSAPSTARNRQAKEAEGEEETSIKKPLNAFMLYMKEMRAKVVAECTLKESAAINQILGGLRVASPPPSG